MGEKGGIFEFLSAGDLSRLGRVSIGSRFTAEGAIAGSHKSQRKGVSVEFADYRQYVAGDDPSQAVPTRQPQIFQKPSSTRVPQQTE